MLETWVGGTVLRLLPQRAAYLPEHGMLLVADAHIGKAQSFRRWGIPVPCGTTGDTLGRLSSALAATGAGHVVFLGDLLHSACWKSSRLHAAVAAWRAAHAGVRMTLVRGNHDSHAGDPPADWDIACVDGPLLLGDGLALAHYPEPLSQHAERYVLAGHVHPAAVLGGRARDSLRLPCFHFGPQVGVLPAFGAFTGMHVLPRDAAARVFVVADDAVRSLPPLAA